MDKNENDETEKRANPARSGMAGIAHADSPNWEQQREQTSIVLRIEHNRPQRKRLPSMLATITYLIDTYNVPRIVAVLAYRYLKGIDTLSDVVMNMPRMDHWFLFCRMVEKESGLKVGTPSVKSRKSKME